MGRRRQSADSQDIPLWGIDLARLILLPDTDDFTELFSYTIMKVAPDFPRLPVVVGSTGRWFQPIGTGIRYSRLPLYRPVSAYLKRHLNKEMEHVRFDEDYLLNNVKFITSLGIVLDDLTPGGELEDIVLRDRSDNSIENRSHGFPVVSTLLREAANATANFLVMAERGIAATEPKMIAPVGWRPPSNNGFKGDSIPEDTPANIPDELGQPEEIEYAVE